MSARRGADGGSEASTIDVETPSHIEEEGAEKRYQKKITDQNSSREPDAQEQGEAYQQLEPREKEGEEGDQHVRENLIIVNDLCKRLGVDDFVITCINKNPSQEQPR